MPFVRLLVIYAVVIAVVVAFFERGPLMQMLGLTLESDGGAVASAPAQDAQGMADKDREVAPGDDAGNAGPDDGAPAAQPLQTPVADTSAQAQPVTPPAPQAASGAQPLQTPVAAPVAAPTPTETEAQTTAAQPTDTAPGQAAPAASSDDVAALLAQARRAYWQGDKVGAETAYLAIVEKTPDNADVLGELGNLYYGQRKYAAAANYYFLAGKQLIKDGKTPQVMALIGVLQSIAPARAAELRSLATQ